MARQRLLTKDDVCEALRVSESTLDRWIARKRFPPGIRTGRKVYWPTQDVDYVLYLMGRGCVFGPEDDEKNEEN